MEPPRTIGKAPPAAVFRYDANGYDQCWERQRSIAILDEMAQDKGWERVYKEVQQLQSYVYTEVDVPPMTFDGLIRFPRMPTEEQMESGRFLSHVWSWDGYSQGPLFVCSERGRQALDLACTPADPWQEVELVSEVDYGATPSPWSPPSLENAPQ